MGQRAGCVGTGYSIYRSLIHLASRDCFVIPLARPCSFLAMTKSKILPISQMAACRSTGDRVADPHVVWRGRGNGCNNIPANAAQPCHGA